MTKSRIVTAVVALGVVAAGSWYYLQVTARNVTSFRYATVERTNLESTVTATGALSAVRTVQVGTQVSGQVSALYVDFNDKVTKGQLLARIDPILQQQAVAESEASLERSQAQLQLAEADYTRNKALFEAKIVTESEWSVVQANFAVAKSNVRSSQINADKARQNLAYTNIYAPIAGVIVSRAVDVGQTVAASLSTPEIFRIAEDLTEMQILASVDESDIGKIAKGQPVAFTVTAYANRTFKGEVEQVRLLSALTENVVNYTVVVSVTNVDGQLLPGMTATVKFQTNSVTDVLAVPNSALRFTPTAEMLGADSVLLNAPATVAVSADTAQRRGGAPISAAAGTTGAVASSVPGGAPVLATQAGASGTPSGAPNGAPNGARRSGAGRGAGGAPTILWVLDSLGQIKAVRVRTGLTDGQKTEIYSRDVTAGMQVAIGVLSGAAAAEAATSNNPFQQTQQRGRGPGGF